MGCKMNCQVENINSSPETKTPRKGRDRGRSTKQKQDTINGNKPKEQMTTHTETSNGCDATDAVIQVEGPTKIKQKDNAEVHQTETPELAQNKLSDGEIDKDKIENTGDDDEMEGEQERVPGSSGEDKDRIEKCKCERCSKCRVSNQGFKHNTVKNIKSIVKEIIWPEEIKRLVLVFGHEQETVEVGRIKARGHLAKVTLGACRVQFKEEIQQEDEITVLEDASGLIYGVQQRSPDCIFEEMVKIRLVVNRGEVTAVRHQKDLRDRVIDCTDHNELTWVMQGTDWSHYRGKGLVAGKETPMSKWLDKMEKLTGEVEDLYGVSLLWQRDRNKHMLMEELLCLVINKITPEISVCIKEFYKQRQRADPDYESNDDTVECCRVDGRTVPRLWTQPRVQEHKGK